MHRAGIIGAGRIAWGYDGGHWDGHRSVSHAACLHRHPDTELVAVYDPIADSRTAFETGYKGSKPVSCCADWDRFWQTNLDLVVIASPSDKHLDHILACFKAGIPNILLEKPVTLTRGDFDRVLTAHQALARKPKITVNYFRRFLPQTQHLKDALQTAREAQTLVRVDISYSRGLDVNGVHMLDLLGHIFDATTCPPLDWTDRTDTPNPSFGLTIHGCPIAVLGHPDLGYHGLDIRITTQDGQMTLTRNGLELLYAPKVPNPDYPGFFHLAPAQTVMAPADSHAAMIDGTYLALCDLIDGTGLSPLTQSGFAQDLLTKAQAGS